MLRPRPRAIFRLILVFTLFTLLVSGVAAQLWALQARGKPDLVIQWVRPTPGIENLKDKRVTVFAGDRVPIEMEVANNGRAPVLLPISIQMVDHPGGFDFEERIVTKLKSREKRRVSGMVLISSKQAPGPAQIVFKIDANERIREENESNNTWTMIWNVKP